MESADCAALCFSMMAMALSSRESYIERDSGEIRMSANDERLRLESAGGSGSSSPVRASAASVPRQISSTFSPRYHRHIHKKPRPIFIDRLLLSGIEHALTPRGGKIRKTTDLMAVHSGEIDFQPPPPESSPQPVLRYFRRVAQPSPARALFGRSSRISPRLRRGNARRCARRRLGTNAGTPIAFLPPYSHGRDPGLYLLPGWLCADPARPGEPVPARLSHRRSASHRPGCPRHSFQPQVPHWVRRAVSCDLRLPLPAHQCDTAAPLGRGGCA